MADMNKIALALQGFGAGVQGQGTEFLKQLDDNRKQAMVKDAYQVQKLLEGGNVKGALDLSRNRVELINKLGGDPSDTLEVVKQLEAGDIAGAYGNVTTLVEYARDVGMLPGSTRSASEREWRDLTEGLSPEEVEAAKRYRLGLSNRPTEAMVLANDPGMTGRVATSKAQIAGAQSGATEGAKLEQQLRKLPDIRGNIKLAETEAAARGESMTDLNRAEAAMPGLEETIGELKRLAPLATSTFSGRLFDMAAKEAGFGATKGAEAKAAFIAIVNNQVLPLLRPTFGAAFTAAEGESLRKSMADPDASPEEKMAQLDSFIKQKYRDIQTKKAEVSGAPVSTPATGAPDMSGFKIRSIK